MSNINWFRVADGDNILGRNCKSKKEAVAYLNAVTIDGKPAKQCGFYLEKNTYDNGWVRVKA